MMKLLLLSTNIPSNWPTFLSSARHSFLANIVFSQHLLVHLTREGRYLGCTCCKGAQNWFPTVRGVEDREEGERDGEGWAASWLKSPVAPWVFLKMWLNNLKFICLPAIIVALNLTTSDGYPSQNTPPVFDTSRDWTILENEPVGKSHFYNYRVKAVASPKKSVDVNQ